MQSIIINLFIFILYFQNPAMAYIGPGIGGGFLAIIAGFILTIFGAIAIIIYYPIKKFFYNKKKKKKKLHNKK